MWVIRRGSLLAAVVLLASCGGGGGGGKGSSGGGGGSPFAVSNPFAVSEATSVEQVEVDDLWVFGDSYSDLGFAGGALTMWSARLDNNGTVADNNSYAVGGAQANAGAANSFAAQLDRFDDDDDVSIGNRDLTVVYFGYNDLASASLAAAETGYQAGVTRLLAAGAADSDRRLFVTLLHDWSRNPGTNNVTTARVEEWNGFVTNIANNNNRVVAVDLFTVFNRIYDDFTEFGFDNVTSVDAANSGTTALYYDPTHFGNRGQDVIARVYRHYLTRAWDWSNTLTAGSATASRLNEDINNNVLVLGLDAGNAEQPLGFSSFTFGGAGAARAQARSFADAPAAAGFGAAAIRDPSRASFAEAHGGAPASGGIALDYRPAANHRVGVAVARYDSSTETIRPASRLVQEQSSDAVALYWQQAHAGFTGTTQFAWLQHSYADRAHDVDVGRQGVNRHAGRSFALDQQIARPLRTALGTITPWASLGYRSQDLEPYTAKSLYTSDVRFSGATVSDVDGALGLELRSAAIELGHGRALRLLGGATYRTSLYRDDVEVGMREAALPGLRQTETIERERIERFDLALDAVLALDDDLELRAAYAFMTNRFDHEQRLRFSLAYRF